MIRIDEIWLSTQPMDMRAGMDTTMAQVVRAFGYIKPHCTYLFCNKRGHRISAGT
ncbi:IS66 family insertion sequence element accessory protein TnpB [Acinetobacter baumannii]|uniref:IS66 family insertion sequence element accessory protein TnpB n=1 Tax=Acinetobacter baumannii TaxID=470 RepID=UPI00193DEE81|nr:IS66 family insertion sequence element accessory protein TnpB [Acinetobacter baumannii]QRN23258.1 IS66 family insertion sequence element accessory protein TnpB [Acinetobacter baumannii]